MHAWAPTPREWPAGGWSVGRGRRRTRRAGLVLATTVSGVQPCGVSLTAAQALVLQCVLVAMYQFVQLDRHLQAIGQLGCSETLLHILMDYGPSFKAGCSPVEPHTTLDGACTHTRRAGAEVCCLRCLPPRPRPLARPTHPNQGVPYKLSSRTARGTQVLGAELLELLLQQRSFFQDVLLHDGVSVTAIATTTATSRRFFPA